MEQLKLSFELKKSILPRELDRLLVSFFKASIQNYSSELFEMLYNKNSSIIKTYTFGYYLPDARFQENSIQLSNNNFTVFFSDADLGELIHFYNAFKLMKFKEYPVNNNSMKLISLTTQKRQKITDSEIVIKMQGSLIARRHNSENNTDRYYTYNEDDFGTVVKENVRCFLEKTRIPVSLEGFSITPVKGKKVVVPVFGRNTDASIGIYKLTGKPELLNLLYFAGIGSRRSEGHGKFEVLL